MLSEFPRVPRVPMSSPSPFQAKKAHVGVEAQAGFVGGWVGFNSYLSILEVFDSWPAALDFDFEVESV